MLLAFLACICAMLLSPASMAHAAAMPSTSPDAAINADANLPAPAARRAMRDELLPCIATAQPGDTPAKMFAAPARFDCARDPADFGHGSFWLRLTPRTGDGLSRLGLLSYVAAWQSMASLSALREDGSIASVRLDNHALSALTRMGGRIIVPVPEAHSAGIAETPLDGPSAASPVTAMLLHVDGAVNAAGLANDAHLLNDAAADREERGETIIYAMFFGLCFALLAYNLVLWTTIREAFQLAYCATMASMLVYIWSYSGGLAVSFPDIDYSMHDRVSYAALAACGTMAMAFFARFLEPGMVPRTLQRLVRASGIGLLVIGLAILVAPISLMPALDRIYALAFMLVPLLSVAMACTAVRRGSLAVKVLILAWALPVAMTVLRLLQSFRLIGFSLFMDHSPVLAMASEALLSSLAMASRIKLLAEERDMARAEEQVARRLADVDPLTGLLNRRALLENVLGWESDEPLRLLLIDVDHFKAINDNFGHDTGDEVLRELADLLGERTGLCASIGRMGGEEFALVGTASELSAGLALAILSDVRAHRFAGRHRLTVSIGMAEGPVYCEEDWTDIYRRADAALYAAKGSGRNRVIDQGARQPVVPLALHAEPRVRAAEAG